MKAAVSQNFLGRHWSEEVSSSDEFDCGEKYIAPYRRSADGTPEFETPYGFTSGRPVVVYGLSSDAVFIRESDQGFAIGDGRPARALRLVRGRLCALGTCGPLWRSRCPRVDVPGSSTGEELLNPPTQLLQRLLGCRARLLGPHHDQDSRQRRQPVRQPQQLPAVSGHRPQVVHRGRAELVAVVEGRGEKCAAIQSGCCARWRWFISLSRITNAYRGPASRLGRMSPVPLCWCRPSSPVSSRPADRSPPVWPEGSCPSSALPLHSCPSQVQPFVHCAGSMTRRESPTDDSSDSCLRELRGATLGRRTTRTRTFPAACGMGRHATVRCANGKPLFAHLAGGHFTAAEPPVELVPLGFAAFFALDYLRTDWAGNRPL